MKHNQINEVLSCWKIISLPQYREEQLFLRKQNENLTESTYKTPTFDEL